MNYQEEYEYSDKYQDGTYEYRHVIIPKHIAKQYWSSSKHRKLHEMDWRRLGIQQSRGWCNYAVHKPESHVFLFRRPIGIDSRTGTMDVYLVGLMKDGSPNPDPYSKELCYRPYSEMDEEEEDEEESEDLDYFK